MAEDRAADVARAWVLRQDGASIRRIAEALECSTGKAHTLVREAADAEQVIGSEDRSTARIREAAALDAWQAAAETRLTDDPLAAVPVLLRVSAARRALLGLDAPTRVALETAPRVAEPDPEITAAVARAQERAAAERAEIRAGRDRNSAPAA